jgi:hypothetical protein
MSGISCGRRSIYDFLLAATAPHPYPEFSGNPYLDRILSDRDLLSALQERAGVHPELAIHLGYTPSLRQALLDAARNGDNDELLLKALDPHRSPDAFKSGFFADVDLLRAVFERASQVEKMRSLLYDDIDGLASGRILGQDRDYPRHHWLANRLRGAKRFAQDTERLRRYFRGWRVFRRRANWETDLPRGAACWRQIVTAMERTHRPSSTPGFPAGL